MTQNPGVGLRLDKTFLKGTFPGQGVTPETSHKKSASVLQKSEDAPDLFPTPTSLEKAVSNLADVRIEQKTDHSESPFPPRLAAELQKIVGRPITPAEITSAYADILPECVPFIDEAKMTNRGLSFKVAFADRQGKVIASVAQRLGRDPNGALELFVGDLWVEHSHRARGAAVLGFDAQLELLKSLSTHPKTRLTLWAGEASNPNNKEQKERIGPYIWGCFGFEFAQDQGLQTELTNGRTRPRCEEDATVASSAQSDRELMVQQFGIWLDRQVKQGTIDVGGDVVEKMKRAFALLDKPWEMATFNIEGMTIPMEVGGKMRSCRIGKAFLLSADAPRWEGAFFINDTDSVGASVSQKFRGPAARMSRASSKKWEEGLIAKLGTGSKEEIQAIAERCGAEVIPLLQEHAAQHRTLGPVIEKAIETINGETRTKNVAQRVLDQSNPMSNRTRALQTYLGLHPEDPEGLLEQILQPKDHGDDVALMSTALRALKISDLPTETLTNIAEHAYETGRSDAKGEGSSTGRTLFQERVDARLAAVELLAQLDYPAAQDLLLHIGRNDKYWEVGATALIALSKNESVDRNKIAPELRGFLEKTVQRHLELKRKRPPNEKLMGRLAATRGMVLREFKNLPTSHVEEALKTAANDPFWGPQIATIEAYSQRPDADLERVLGMVPDLHRRKCPPGGLCAIARCIAVCGESGREILRRWGAVEKNPEVLMTINRLVGQVTTEGSST